jgi:hypothetical protein
MHLLIDKTEVGFVKLGFSRFTATFGAPHN